MSTAHSKRVRVTRALKTTTRKTANAIIITMKLPSIFSVTSPPLQTTSLLLFLLFVLLHSDEGAGNKCYTQFYSVAWNS